MKTNKIVYWISTCLVAAMMLMSGIMYLSKAPQLMEAMTKLGLPDYMRVILGIAKIAGAVALVVPMFQGIKEWAYAGFTFVLIGAAWTHIATGVDSPVGPIIILVVLSVSYYFRKKINAASVS